MSFVKASGEVEDFGDRGTLVPDSFYKVRLSVGPDPQVTETAEDGSGGGTPFIDLVGEILDGPFQMGEINRRLYITPGRVKYDEKTGAERGGGFIMFLNSACHQVTGKQADEAMLAGVGFVTPGQQPGEGDRDYGKRTRLEFARFFETLDPAQRLDLMLKYLRIPEWNGKVVVTHVGLETRKDPQGRIDDATGEVLTFSNNSWDGFFALGHKKRGEKYLAIAHVQQKKTLDEQEA